MTSPEVALMAKAPLAARDRKVTVEVGVVVRLNSAAESWCTICPSKDEVHGDRVCILCC